MVLSHVSESSRLLVETPAIADAVIFSNRDLHVVYIPTVPYGLEDRIREAEDKEVLHGLFAEVVVDPEDLVLREVSRDDPVQLVRGPEIAPERFLDDQAMPPRRA